MLKTHLKEGPPHRRVEDTRGTANVKCGLTKTPLAAVRAPLGRRTVLRGAPDSRDVAGVGVPAGRADGHKQGPWSGEDRRRLQMPLPSRRPTRLPSRQRFGNLQPRMCQNRHVS